MANRIKPEFKNSPQEKVEKLKLHFEKIDKIISNMIKEIIERTITDKEKVSKIYLKTYYGNMTYNICLYSSLTKNIVGKSYDVKTLLELCSGREDISFEVNRVTKTLIAKLDNKNNYVDKEGIHWI